MTLASQTLRLVFQFGGGAVLARLLTPNDYGLVGMVSAVTGILMVFGDLGISDAIVQRSEVSHRQVSALFWLNVAVGLGLTLSAIALGPLLAWFYGDQRLTSVTAVLGSGFFIGGLGVQHRALLKRHMRFSALSTMEVAVGFISMVTGIVLAWVHVGYWALVFMQLSASLTLTVGAWIACNWRPGLPSREAGIGAMVIFGRNTTVFTALNYLVRNLDNMLVGWRWGPIVLGQYAKAYNLLLFPLMQINAPITSTAIPTLSRLQAEPCRYRAYYLEVLKVIAYITVPLIMFLGIFSKEIVYLVLGPQWSQAAVFFQLLSIAAVLQPVANTAGWLYLSRNRSEAMARWGLISAPCFVLAFVIGLPWGATGVAIGYGVVTWALLYPCFAMATRGTPISMKDVFLAVQRPCCVGIIFGSTMFVCEFALRNYGVIVRLEGSVIVGVLMIWILKHVWSEFRGDIKMISKIVQMIREPI